MALDDYLYHSSSHQLEDYTSYHHHEGLHRSLQTETLMVDDITGEELISPVDDDGGDDGENRAMQLSYAILTNAFLFFLIFGLSATVQVKTLRHQLTNKLAICTGVAMQFIIMPVLGFLAVLLLQGTGFTQPMGMTLLVVTASPGGSYSNWWCSLFNAELALSVAMTSVSSILSIGLLPMNLFIYTWLAYTVILPRSEAGGASNIFDSLEFGPVFISLGVVLAAILSGLYAGYKFDNAKFHKRANAFGSVCGLLLILFSVFLSSGTGGSSTNFFNLPWSFYVGTAFPCVLGMALANILSRFFNLSRPECVAISIECCYQNTAIATSVAVTMFSDPDDQAAAVSVPLLYGIVEAVIIGLYCVWAWKVGWTKAPKDENICVVVTKTYEVHEDGAGDNENGPPGIPVTDVKKKQTTTAKDDDEEDDEVYDLEQDKRAAQAAASATTSMNTSSSTITTTSATVSTRSGDTIISGRSISGPLHIDGTAKGGSAGATITPAAGGDRDRFYSADATSTSTPATAPITPMTPGTPGNQSLDEFPSPTPPRDTVRVRLDLDVDDERHERGVEMQIGDMQDSFGCRMKTPAPPKHDEADLPKPPSRRVVATENSVGQEVVFDDEKHLFDLDESFPKPPSGRKLLLDIEALGGSSVFPSEEEC